VKLSNINFHENLSSGGDADTCAKTDRRADKNQMFGNDHNKIKIACIKKLRTD